MSILDLRRISKLNKNQIYPIINIIKKVNTETIISTLDASDLKKYLTIHLENKKNYLFLAYYKKEIIGYIMYTDLKLEMSLIHKLFFLYCFLKKLQIITILNIFLKITHLDKIFFLPKNKKIYCNSINLSYLGIKQNYQSRGYGRRFFFETIKLLKKKRIITTETFNRNAQRFYEIKCKFNHLGNKFQFFKKTKVYYFFKHLNNH
jgi:hypothetical protein